MTSPRKPRCQWFGCREPRDYRLHALAEGHASHYLDVCLVHMPKGIGFLTNLIKDLPEPKSVTETAYLNM